MNDKKEILFGNNFVFLGFDDTKKRDNIIKDIRRIENDNNVALKAWFGQVRGLYGTKAIFVIDCVCEELTNVKITDAERKDLKLGAGELKVVDIVDARLKKYHTSNASYGLCDATGSSPLAKKIEDFCKKKNEQDLKCGLQNENIILLNMKDIETYQGNLELNSYIYAATILHELTHMIESKMTGDSYFLAKYPNVTGLLIESYITEENDMIKYIKELKNYQNDLRHERLTSMVELLVYLLLQENVKKDWIDKLTDGLQNALKEFK